MRNPTPKKVKIPPPPQKPVNRLPPSANRSFGWYTGLSEAGKRLKAQKPGGHDAAVTDK